jgi:CHAD domain-containing protein
VLAKPLALEELHDLRIACKKLRYMLELLPDENKLAVQIGKSLQKLQDILGSVHDSDFTIGYLRSLPQSSKEIQEIINMENDERRLKFEQFMNYCKRRLRISPESFLIKIRSFKLRT